MVPKDAGCVGGMTVEVGGTAVGLCGVCDGGTGDGVAVGEAKKLHPKIKMRKMERVPIFLFMIFCLEFSSSLH
jgi:hypothetical protein